MNIRLLRGQVVVRENLTADTDHYRHIIVPGVSTAHDADAVQRARKWHRGTVLAVGAPMLSKTGAEILPEFKVGDEVLFHWQHREKSWTREWSDGLLACWVPQAYVDAVLEHECRCIGCGEYEREGLDPRCCAGENIGHVFHDVDLKLHESVPEYWKTFPGMIAEHDARMMQEVVLDADCISPVKR